MFALLARLPIAYPHMTARYVDLIGFAKKRYPDQFQRFDAANPGLPDDLERLTALPNAVPDSSGDPIFIPLVSAVAVLGLGTLFVVKVVMPRLNRPTPSEYSEPTTGTTPGETTPGTSGTQGSAITYTGTQTCPILRQTAATASSFPPHPQRVPRRSPLGRAEPPRSINPSSNKAASRTWWLTATIRRGI